MSLEEKRRLILAFNILIRSKVPGGAEYLSKRLGISRATFLLLIEYMKEELYAPVIFDTVQNRYAYESEGIVMFRFLPAEIIDVEKAKRIAGGMWIKCDKQILIVSTVETLAG